MKVIFLDIDGVLNSRNSTFIEDQKNLPGFSDYTDTKEGKALLLFHRDRLDKNSIMCLNYILEKVPDLQIIVHSTWTIYYSIEEVQAALEHMGLTKGRIIGTTPKKFSSEKIHEIGWARQDFEEDYKEPLEKYLIIENSDIGIKKNIHLVDDDIGLCFKDLEKIISHFDPDFEMEVIEV